MTFALSPAVAQSEGEKPAETKTADAVEVKAPPEIPKPAVISAGSLLILDDKGRIVGTERYKVVKSKHSGLMFASGVQRGFSKALTVERYKKLSNKKRALRKLRTWKRAHHFELSETGRVTKYKTWHRTDKDREYVLLYPRDQGITRRYETLSVQKSNRVAAGAGTFPFRPDQYFLVRLATRRALSSGGSLPVIDPPSGKVATLTVSRDGNALVLGGAGAGGRIENDASGRFVSYTYKNRTLRLKKAVLEPDAPPAPDDGVGDGTSIAQDPPAEKPKAAATGDAEKPGKPAPTAPHEETTHPPPTPPGDDGPARAATRSAGDEAAPAETDTP